MDYNIRVIFESLNGDTFGTEISALDASLIVSDWATGAEETEAGDHTIDLIGVVSIKFSLCDDQ